MAGQNGDAARIQGTSQEHTGDVESLDWDKAPPAPALPEEVVNKTRDKYLEAFRLVTGGKISEAG